MRTSIAREESGSSSCEAAPAKGSRRPRCVRSFVASQSCSGPRQARTELLDQHTGQQHAARVNNSNCATVYCGLAHADLHQVCGCAPRFPAVGVYPLRLRQWAACTGEPYLTSVADRGNNNSLDAEYPWATGWQRWVGSSYGKLSSGKLLSLTGVSNGELTRGMPLRMAAPELHRFRESDQAECLAPSCLLKQLAGQWILFLGDSTHRNIFDAVLALLRSRYGASLHLVRPHVGSSAIADRDGQMDYDTVCTLPRDAGAGTTQRKRNTTVLVSMRFLRGLDQHKLGIHARDWRQRFSYPAWRGEYSSIPRATLIRSDAYTAHPLTATHFESREQPNVIVFHSCAWDMPAVNRSGYYYPNTVCVPPPPTVTVKLENGSRVTVRTQGANCAPRGILRQLSDKQVFAGYRQKLLASLRDIRSLFTGRLIVRNCHAGIIARKGLGKSRQAAALVQMNTIIDEVARLLCVEVLDVYELDRAAGFFRGKNDDFHVSPKQSTHAALALMLQLRLRGSQKKNGC